MVTLEALKRKLILWTERLRPPTTSTGFIVDPGGGIEDGVDYNRPQLLPAWVRREMAKDASLHESVIAALREADASRYRSQFGDPYAQNSAVMPVTENPLMEWDWQTRERVLSNCHAAYARNPLAYAGVQLTTYFVIGDGFNLSTKNKEVERVLQAFIDHPENAIREYEQQAMTDLQVDGELLLRIKAENNEVIVAPQRPWELQYIDTDPGFFRRINFFRFNYDLSRGDNPAFGGQSKEEDVPADEILFVAINRHAYELRGRPDLYRLLPWLRADTEWLSDRARQSKWRNALLWVVNVANATSGIIAAVAARWRKPPSPGSVAVESSNVTVTAATNSSNAADAGNDGRAIRLMNVIGFLMAEYMFGDGQNANLATATKQELPALTKFEAYQQILIQRLWTPLFKRVIENAIAAGELDEEVEEQGADGEPLDTVADSDSSSEREGYCKAVEAFSVTYEPVTQQDIQALTNALNVQAQNGWIDGITAMEKLGNDPHMVQKRLADQREKEREDMDNGLRPIPPGMEIAMGQGDTPQDQQQQQPEAA